jgi:hypothetical protein
MENEVKKIGSPARHFTNTIKDRGVRGCIRIRQEAAPANQSCVAPRKFQSQAINYQGGGALSCLVVVGGHSQIPQSKVLRSLAPLPVLTASLLQPIRPGYMPPDPAGLPPDSVSSVGSCSFPDPCLSVPTGRAEVPRRRVRGSNSSKTKNYQTNPFHYYGFILRINPLHQFAFDSFPKTNPFFA